VIREKPLGVREIEVSHYFERIEVGNGGLPPLLSGTLKKRGQASLPDLYPFEVT
jgi:hypothetical protein